MKQNLHGALRASIGLIACLALAVPGQALVKEANTSKTKIASANSSNAAATSKKAVKQHCMKTQAVTGSRLQQHQCKTIAEWEALGYEFESNR